MTSRHPDPAPAAGAAPPKPAGAEADPQALSDLAAGPPGAPVPDYKALEPRKSRWARPMRRLLQYWLARAVLLLASFCTVRALQRLGRGIGRLGMSLAPVERQVAETQLRLALPELEAQERERLVRRCFEHLGMTACEALSVRRIRKQAAHWVRIEGEPALRAAWRRGQGVIVVTAHTGNWELLSVAHDLLRIPMVAVVAPLHNERLNALMLEQRTSEFCRILVRGSPEAPRQLLACLKRGDVLVLVIDQDMNVQSVFVDFFGRPARTPRVAASLALRMGSALMTGIDVRQPDGTHVIAYRELSIPDSARQAADPELALTQAISLEVERQIRQHPEQWAWNHRRWLHRPEPIPTALSGSPS